MPAFLKTHARAATAATLAFAALGVFAGCGTKTVETDDVQNEIKDKLKEQQGVEVENVKCPDDMEAKKGKEYTCDLEAQGQKLKVKVTMTNDDGNFEFQVIGA